MAMQRIVHFSNLLDRINFDWDSECWNWALNKNAKGYGRTSYLGKRYIPHRLSKFLFGHITEETLRDSSNVIMHLCDNPSCINPEHLVLGTHADNIADRDRKERTAKGIRHGMVKLTEQDVKVIRSEYKHGVPMRRLAKDFPVSLTQIKRIINKQSWKHI